jgi:hypothetical protein
MFGEVPCDRLALSDFSCVLYNPRISEEDLWERTTNRGSEHPTMPGCEGPSDAGQDSIFEGLG